MLHKKNTTHLYWLVVWNISIILPYIGNSYPNMLNFAEGLKMLKPPTSWFTMFHNVFHNVYVYDQ